MKTQLSNEGLHIYQHIANNIEKLIISGTLKVGDKLHLEDVYTKKGYAGKIELSTRSATVASIMPT